MLVHGLLLALVDALARSLLPVLHGLVGGDGRVTERLLRLNEQAVNLGVDGLPLLLCCVQVRGAEGPLYLVTANHGLKATRDAATVDVLPSAFHDADHACLLDADDAARDHRMVTRLGRR